MPKLSLNTKLVLAVIVISQFCCTSLWFAGNGVMEELLRTFTLNESALGHLTSAVQFGFITGTLTFAVLTISDRFSPSKVFLFCAISGALFNLGLSWEKNSLASLVLFRFATGFFLAGVYPVGMKIAADHFKEGLGKSLGYLVGALVLGTALPHLLKEIVVEFPWEYVMITTSSLALFGGMIMLMLVPDGPYRSAGQEFDFSAFFRVFQNRDFRSAAFGYFGHMWELYAFWTFVPVILKTFNSENSELELNVSIWSFLIIGLGGLACVVGGHLSQSFGIKRIAFIALMLSCLCCLASPIFLETNSALLLIGFLVFWGLVVIADSPLFSTMVANNASPEIKGTALTIVNCVGFAITILSIQLLTWMQEASNSSLMYMVLAIGPIFGLIALKSKKAQHM